MTDRLLTDRLGTSFAVFDSTRTYRYALGRTWDVDLPACAFVMLNPSTADAFRLDPTVRRCMGFAKRWGYGTLLVGNAFALRSTDPKALYEAADPVGPANDEQLRLIGERAHLVIAAWGNHGALGARGPAVMRILRTERLAHLGFTKAGQPRHPLYVRADTKPEAYA